MEDTEQAQVEEVRAKTKLRKRSWKFAVTLILLKGIAMSYVIIAASFLIHGYSLLAFEHITKKADKIYTSMLEALPKSIIPRQAQIAARLPYTLDEAIKRVAREQRVPEVALAAMVEQESSNNAFPTSKIEEKTYLRLKKAMPDADNDRIENLARAHGPAHVMGITALEICGMEYIELYDNYKGLTCAARYLRMQIDKTSAPSIEEKLWQAFRRYNGEGAAAEKHADRVYALMRKKMTGSLSKELS